MKPLDLSKFRKAVNKSLKIQDGYHDPKTWVHTGNYALNMMISGSFFKGVPLGKVTVFAGESGSGKSYICAGNLVRECQKSGIMPVILDSEYALDESWLQAVGVDTAEDKLIRWPVVTVDDCAGIVTQFMKEYEGSVGDAPIEDRPKILFIVDSLGALQTPTDVAQFEKGDMKGDMGRKAKQLRAFVMHCLKLMGPENIGLVATNHTYASQDMFNPDDVISGGQGFIFASSIVVAMKKLKLKLDENGNKITHVTGIRSKMKCVKSRYAKPFEEVEVHIPYESGMDPHSGLWDMFEAKELIKKEGSMYSYINQSTGEVIKKYRKNYDADDYTVLMAQWEDDRKETVNADLDAPEDDAAADEGEVE
jgi:RecA/RadA recombinase